MTIGRGTRVLFVCDFPPGFNGRLYRSDGVGGTQALVVLMAEELARRGVSVTVTTRGAAETMNGVAYESIGPATAASAPDVTVLVKRWSDAVPRSSQGRIFLVTDVHVDPDAQIDRCRAWCDIAFAGTEFNRASVERVIGAGKIIALGWPVDVAVYADAPRTRDNVLIYCSVPDRGLYYLKDLFPRIRRRVPDARLLITSDFSLWGLTPARDAFLRFFDGQPGVDYRGHLDRTALVDAQKSAKVMAYPCNFPEGFCLSAAECLAAGTVPVTTRAFALTETVGDAGVLIGGRPRGWWYKRQFVAATVKLLTDDAHWSARSSAGRRRAARCAPSRVIDDFIRLATAAPRPPADD